MEVCPGINISGLEEYAFRISFLEGHLETSKWLLLERPGINISGDREPVGIFDGGGSYFNLHTAKQGFGLRVDNKTMAMYLRRYGVTSDNDAGILSLLESEEVPATKKICIVCTQLGKFVCSKCANLNYCSKECQASHWKLHKVHCKMMKAALEKSLEKLKKS